uniref:Sphingomyelin synthase-like domain-containing protein n=1 Tax=Corethron hystrix TaxID=216773 RepID=A0A7S1BH40_9STRA|mmetsp:Transcript_25208/g.58239  ORF Transcript_25208/g.58239 Transcript_25208/m.58239 type:complete len:413 (+) Transcript_25208:105-1343(+)|eukprot:CAMPEP_0113308912 /NCGR_PEP_ID=MMETSP0010_2-20120614/7172_1 /TAXON_ID=216773 ORGANISM="Corethron hystrix, Strain 308" /NCGR_SAMPLE_ID=MMETSP0010_2 /ASSEMBLY_ACC=CAM_ASM_000155 /LENGTH=412 /DNA_ID=CAMNT_0000164071 /DNA_START=19 /DNA_END=1257 /DNA_ORIENTATION=- /assembly_acc=CAM_ASM_000155
MSDPSSKGFDPPSDILDPEVPTQSTSTWTSVPALSATTADDSTSNARGSEYLRDEPQAMAKKVSILTDMKQVRNIPSNGSLPNLPNAPSRRSSSLREMNDGIKLTTKLVNGEEISMKTKVLAVTIPLTTCLVSNFIYMSMSGFAQRTYLEFVEQDLEFWANDKRLPDIILDAFESSGWYSKKSLLVWTTVSDAFPAALFAVCACYLIWNGHYVTINRCLLTQSFLMLLNSLAENLTILPSSYGYDRCLEYLNITSSSDLPDYSFSPTGSCAAMIWSGHCVHTLIAAHMLGCAWAEDHPTTGFPVIGKYIPNRVFNVIKPKTFLLIFLGLLELVFLALAKGHYSVDMLVGIIISILCITNHSLKTIFLIYNPFLKKMIDPDEMRLMMMPHGELLGEARRLREILKERGEGDFS